MRNLSILRYSVFLLAILCASCGTALPTIKPYKLDVQQGNVVTSKMLLQLRPGMTQSQVRFIMGTPLIQDSFHGKRWDYVYQMRENGKITEQRRVILDFENDLLKAVRGDVVPSGSELTKPGDGAANTGPRVINPSAKTEKQSLFSKLKFWEKDEAELAEDAAALKAKTETDESEKNAAEMAKKKLVKEKVAKEKPAPVEEAKSVLAMPIEISPAIEAPAIVADVPVAAAPVEAVPVVQEVAVQTPVAEAKNIVSESVESQAINITPEQKLLVNAEVATTESTPMPATPPAYDSPSGMKFDRTLILASEGNELATKPEVAMPRAGNKNVPKPKELPAEDVPSFFERMLEKIGF
jgi:outer membrane protein assembly factor BamE